jgi:hypothetical protein
MDSSYAAHQFDSQECEHSSTIRAGSPAVLHSIVLLTRCARDRSAQRNFGAGHVFTLSDPPLAVSVLVTALREQARVALARVSYFAQWKSSDPLPSETQASTHTRNFTGPRRIWTGYNQGS